jgi:hypothetical protein
VLPFLVCFIIGNSRESAVEAPAKRKLIVSAIILLALSVSPALAVTLSEREALFFTLNTVFAVINATLAISCCLLTYKIVRILSDKKSIERLKAGYFLSMEFVSLSWKLIFAALVLFALQYSTTTLFLLGREILPKYFFAIPTVYVLLVMYVVEALFIILLSFGIMVNYQIMRKYTG